MINIFSRSETRKLSWVNDFLSSHLPLKNVYGKSQCAPSSPGTRTTSYFSLIHFQNFALINLKLPEYWFHSCPKYLTSHWGIEIKYNLPGYLKMQHTDFKHSHTPGT